MLLATRSSRVSCSAHWRARHFVRLCRARFRRQNPWARSICASTGVPRERRGGRVFRIGEFSRIARVSARLLRFYDELGLFKPGVVDPVTGYRFYTATQLLRLNRILVLKELGLSLEQIGAVIDEAASADELRAILQARRADAERTLADETARLRQIEARIADLDAGAS